MLSHATGEVATHEQARALFAPAARACTYACLLPPLRHAVQILPRSAVLPRALSHCRPPSWRCAACRSCTAGWAPDLSGGSNLLALGAALKPLRPHQYKPLSISPAKRAAPQQAPVFKTSLFLKCHSSQCLPAFHSCLGPCHSVCLHLAPRAPQRDALPADNRLPQLLSCPPLPSALPRAMTTQSLLLVRLAPLFSVTNCCSFSPWPCDLICLGAQKSCHDAHGHPYGTIRGAPFLVMLCILPRPVATCPPCNL